MPTFIEVCAGAGGLSKGFIDNNFTPILLNEINKTCCQTLKENHPNVDILCDSMENIACEKYKNIDVLIGGVPCQSFSQAGERKGLNDKRGNLALVFAELLQKIKPKVFMIENVKGLITHNSGNTLKFILNALSLDGLYNIEYKVLNANHYGVAQKRERVFIVGVHKKIKKKYAFPKPLESRPILRDILLDCPDSEGYSYPEHKKKVMELVPPGGCWVNLPEAIQKSYMKKSFYSGGGKRGIARRLSLDEACLTLTTSPCQKQTERCHPTEVRPLNIIEYSRIQSFPDDYVFVGSLSSKYKQIGNAVPVVLAGHVANSISKLFSTPKKKK